MHFFYSPDSNRICLVDTDDNGPFNIFTIANCLARSIKFHFPMGSNGITLGTLKNQTTDFVVLAHVGGELAARLLELIDDRVGRHEDLVRSCERGCEVRVRVHARVQVRVHMRVRVRVREGG